MHLFQFKGPFVPITERVSFLTWLTNWVNFLIFVINKWIIRSNNNYRTIISFKYVTHSKYKKPRTSYKYDFHETLLILRSYPSFVTIKLTSPLLVIMLIFVILLTNISSNNSNLSHKLLRLNLKISSEKKYRKQSYLNYVKTCLTAYNS